MSDANVTVILFFILLFLGAGTEVFNLAFNQPTNDVTGNLESDVAENLNDTSGWGVLVIVDVALTIGKIFLNMFVWTFGTLFWGLDLLILGIRIMFIWMIIRTIRGN